MGWIWNVTLLLVHDANRHAFGIARSSWCGPCYLFSLMTNNNLLGLSLGKGLVRRYDCRKFLREAQILFACTDLHFCK